jgi:hypothetical protein
VLAYQKSDALLGKSKELVYRDKIVNEVDRRLKESEKPMLELAM